MKMIHCCLDSRRMSYIIVLSVLILSMLSSCGFRQSVATTSDIDTLAQNTDSIMPEKNDDKPIRIVSRLDLKQDLSVFVINPKRIWAEEMRKEDWTSRPEPLGFRGVDFDRFYIHYDSVSRIDDKRYHVMGKTRCMGTICNIKGDIVIDSIVVMHGFRITCQKRQYVVLLQAFESLLHMCSIERDGLIPIESEACAFRIDENDCVIPVEQF